MAGAPLNRAAPPSESSLAMHDGKGQIRIPKVWHIVRSAPTLKLLHEAAIDSAYIDRTVKKLAERARLVWPTATGETRWNMIGLWGCRNPDWTPTNGRQAPIEPPVLEQCFETSFVTTLRAGDQPAIEIPHTCVVVRHGVVPLDRSNVPGCCRYRIFSLQSIVEMELALAGGAKVQEFVCKPPKA
jgi:hypothetical protein